jgi:hypothetical protein
MVNTRYEHFGIAPAPAAEVEELAGRRGEFFPRRLEHL